jgi:hypothetical protein
MPDVTSSGDGEAPSPDAIPLPDAPQSSLPEGDGAIELEPPTAVNEPSPEPRRLEFHLLYVHGVQNCADDRAGAEGALDELQAAVEAALPSRIAEFEASHAGIELVTTSAHANLYTAAPSGFQPSDSPEPLNMDDWEVGDPGCSAARQGEPCTTAYEWRHRLAGEISERFPPDAENIILIGHSTGARAAFEVAANVGSAGVDTHDWGVRERIAGVVSVHGMIDAGANTPLRARPATPSIGWPKSDTRCS